MGKKKESPLGALANFERQLCVHPQLALDVSELDENNMGCWGVELALWLLLSVQEGILV